ncbi:MAG: hypothetical protein IKD37_07265 [Clostridia bacterium]|nr:hypothetical protein [Clostridia bacterium]
MKHNHLLALLLTALMLCAPLTACSQEPVTSTDTTLPPAADTTTAAPAETEPPETEYPAPQIEANFTGKTISILSLEPEATFDYGEISYGENTGDIINDAVFKRNHQIINKYGIEIKSTEMPRGMATAKAFNTAILSDTNEYQLGILRIADMMSSASNGYLANLTDAPYIDTDAPWYYRQLQEALSIGGQDYILTGYLNMRIFDSVGSIFYNKDVVEKYQLGNLNQLVFDGEWTLDKFAEICAKVGNDLNNDGKIDETDEVGMISHPGGILNFFVGAGGEFVAKDSDDIPQYIGITERNADLLNKVLTVLYTEPGSLHQIYSAYTNYNAAFNEDRALFLNNCLYAMLELAAVSTNFGVLPPPKYDAAQEGYYVHTHSNHGTAIGIPNNNPDMEMTCAIVEELMYWSYKHIYPAHIEKTMQIRYASDEESTRILEIMFDSICLEMSTALSLKCDNNLRNLGNVHSFDFVSAFKSTETADKTKIETYVSAFTQKK